MPGNQRTIARAARDLQAAANRLALAVRARDRDVILAGLYAGLAKGRRAEARLEASAPALAALEAETQALRDELAGMLAGILPTDEQSEPMRGKRK